MKLLTRPDEFRRQIVRFTSIRVRMQLPKIVRQLERDLKKILKDQIRQSPAFNALFNGELKYHFGFNAGDEYEIAGEIFYELINEVHVGYKGFTFPFSIYAYVFDATFERLLSMDAAYTMNEGQKLPWLEWMLKMGDRIIISEHSILFGEFQQSRSGGAIMIKNYSGGWRVPPKYAGTPEDNWITRVIDASVEEIKKVFSDLVNKKLSKLLI